MQTASTASTTAPASSPAAAGSLSRRITLFTIGLFLLAAIGIVTLLLVAASGQDRVATEASHRAVATALAAQVRQLTGFVTDSANWDELMDNAHVSVDREWEEANLEESFLDGSEFDALFVFDADNRVSYAYARDRSQEELAALVDQHLLRQVIAARRNDTEAPVTVAGFLMFGDNPCMFATSRIHFVDDSRSPAPEQSSMLVMGRCLDEAGLQRLQDDYSLSELSAIAEDLNHPSWQRLPLNNFEDEPVAFVAWQPDHPGQALLRSARQPLATLALAMILLLWVVGRSARRAGTVIDRSSAELKEARETLEQKVVERTADLHAAEMRLRAVFENAAEGIFQIGEDGRYLEVNPAMAVIFGYASVQEFLAEATDHTLFDPARHAEFVESMEEFGAVGDFVLTAQRRDGTTIWISQNVRAVHRDGLPSYYEGMLADITHRKRIEQQLVHDALHDALTGLPNRRLFEERLNEAVSRYSQWSPHRAAVLLLDCDRFKLINDSLGHAAGDELLISLAQRLSLCMRRADTLARLGGDEFAVLIEDDEGVPLQLAQRLQEACRRPFLLHGRDVFITLSIGAALVEDEAAEASEVLRNADIAMYRAKTRGRATTVLFEASMHTDVMQRMRLENELRLALLNDEFFVLYQPIMSLADNALAGFEALVRWQHPERGLIPPDQFISIAEESGLIGALGEVVLRKATADVADWLRRTAYPPELFVAVNLSPLQLEVDCLAERIVGILAETGLDPRRLELEITETALMANPNDVRETLTALDALGIRLAMDDFGTGYSSLSQLHSFPFDTLKIDRSFIGKLSSGGDGVAIVRSILMLAQNLRMSVVAEGIEEPAQREWLRAHGCNLGQGWLFGRPIEAAAAEAMLIASRAARAA